MKRIATTSIAWVLALVLAASAAYWVGLQKGRILSANSDLQVVQPLTESQRKLLLRTPASDIAEGVLVSVSAPGSAPQFFLAKSKLDLPNEPKKPEEPLNNPFKNDKPSKDIELVAYPCRVGIDSAGNVLWGVCYRRKF